MKLWLKILKLHLHRTHAATVDLKQCCGLKRNKNEMKTEIKLESTQQFLRFNGLSVHVEYYIYKLQAPGTLVVIVSIHQE